MDLPINKFQDRDNDEMTDQFIQKRLNLRTATETMFFKPENQLHQYDATTKLVMCQATRKGIHPPSTGNS